MGPRGGQRPRVGAAGELHRRGMMGVENQNVCVRTPTHTRQAVTRVDRAPWSVHRGRRSDGTHRLLIFENYRENLN